MKGAKLLAMWMPVTVTVAFLFSSIWGFMALTLLTLLTFEFERIEMERARIGAREIWYKWQKEVSWTL